MIAKDELNKELTLEMQTIRESYEEICASVEQKDLQIRELNILRDSTAAIMKNKELDFDPDVSVEFIDDS